MITSDPTVTGVVTFQSQSLIGLPVEYELNGDDVPDGTIYTETSGSGRFELALGDQLVTATTVNLKLRAGVWSPERLTYDFGDWASFTFDFHPPAVSTPTVTTLELADDEDGDLTTSSPIITGIITGDGDLKVLPIAFDVDGDGNSDGMSYSDISGSGEFTLDLSSYLTTGGQKVVQVQVGNYGSDGNRPLEFSDWQTIEFTYQQPDAATTLEADWADDNTPSIPAASLESATLSNLNGGPLALYVTADFSDLQTPSQFDDNYLQTGVFQVDGTWFDAPGQDVSTSISTGDVTDSVTNEDGTVVETTTNLIHTEAFTAPTASGWYRFDDYSATYTIVTTATAEEGTVNVVTQTGSLD
mgnify:FL=1